MPKITATFTAPPAPFPSSRKKYITGRHGDLRVPVREISLSPHASLERGWNRIPRCLSTIAPVHILTLMPRLISLAGCRALRAPWIEEREDTERLTELSSEYGRQRQNDLLTHEPRFPARSAPRRARDGLNVSQLHYARKGIITPEMEFVALRESMQLDRLAQDPAYALLLRQHRRRSARARNFPKEITPEFVRKEVAAGPCHYSGKYQPS